MAAFVSTLEYSGKTNLKLRESPGNKFNIPTVLNCKMGVLHNRLCSFDKHTRYLPFPMGQESRHSSVGPLRGCVAHPAGFSSGAWGQSNPKSHSGCGQNSFPVSAGLRAHFFKARNGPRERLHRDCTTAQSHMSHHLCQVTLVTSKSLKVTDPAHAWGQGIMQKHEYQEWHNGGQFSVYLPQKEWLK